MGILHNFSSNLLLFGPQLLKREGEKDTQCIFTCSGCLPLGGGSVLREGILVGQMKDFIDFLNVSCRVADSILIEVPRNLVIMSIVCWLVGFLVWINYRCPWQQAHALSLPEGQKLWSIN